METSMKRLSLQMLKYIGVVIVTLYFLLWIFSPQISRPLIKKQLMQYGLELNENIHLRFNPFISQVHLQNVQLLKNKTKVLAIDELKLKVNLFDLLFKQLYIDIFSLDDIYIKVDIQNKDVKVAGFEIPQDTKKEKTEQDRNDIFNIDVVLPQLKITNSKLDITLDGKALPFEIVELVVENVTASKAEQYAEITLKSVFLNTDITVNTQASINRMSSEFSSAIKLKNNHLEGLSAWLPKTINQLSGEASLNSNANIILSNKNIKVELTNTELTSKNISIGQDNVQLNIAHQEFMLSQLKLRMNENQKLNLVGDGTFSAQGIEVFNQELPDNVITSFANIEAGSFNFVDDGDSPMFTLPRLKVEDALLSYNRENDIPALARFKQLKLDDIKLSESRSQIENVKLSGLIVDAQLDQNKQMLNMSSITSISTGATADQTELKTKTSNNTKESIAAFRLGHFSLADEAAVYFSDLSVDPAYKRSFTISEFTMGTIDTQQPELVTELTLMGRSNEYANLAIKGTLQPFLDKPLYAIKGLVKEVSLPSVSSYIKSVLKHEIKSGQLDLDINANIVGTKLSGNTDIIIRGLDFTASDDSEVNSIKDQTAIPFSVALGMLKDSQGNVNLDIPLSGDTNDPSFGTSGFLTLIVKQATMVAAKDYLLTTFVPYANVISIAMTAGEHLLKLRFNDLNYSPRQTSVGSEQEQFAKQFSSLLKDKADTQVTICPVATPADVGLKPGSKIVEKEVISSLTKLSEERFHSFKKYIIDQYNIESSRLLMCSPQIDSDADAKPRLTFST